MIQKFVDKFMAAKPEMISQFKANPPEDYKAIVKAVVKVIGKGEDYDTPSTERIHAIDDGHYQGTLVFVIGAEGYQPSGYWYVQVGYGSCSGCDSLSNIRGYNDETTDQDAKDYWTLALHILQGLKKMGEEV